MTPLVHCLAVLYGAVISAAFFAASVDNVGAPKWLVICVSAAAAGAAGWLTHAAARRSPSPSHVFFPLLGAHLSVVLLAGQYQDIAGGVFLLVMMPPFVAIGLIAGRIFGRGWRVTDVGDESVVPPKPVQTDPGAQCLECGTPLGPRAERCTECGWTWQADSGA